METSDSISDIVNQQNSSLVKSMTHSQEARVSSSQDTLRLSETTSISSVSSLVNKLNSCAIVGSELTDDGRSGRVSATSNQEEKKVETTFPWLKCFSDLCRTSVGSKSFKLLENLLTVYLQHVSIDVKNCYMKPNRAAKLKKRMNEALLFFHMFYQDVREPMEHSFYLNKMTDLMSMYMDMEIIASRRKKETTKKVVSRLTSSLYIFLDHSEHHMLDVILKAKLITRMNKEICTPILGKLMSSLRIPTLYELLYVRCVLVFKLWKKLIKDTEMKKNVTKLALQRLSVPTNFLEKSKLFTDVLPRIPKTKKNITMFFMQAKFNLKTACKAFLKVCKDSQSLGDKHMFYGEHLHDQHRSIADKTVDVGGGRNGNLLNNIWSSISVVTDSSELKALAGDTGKVDVLSGKKQKSQEKNGKKVKNKSKSDKKSGGNSEGTNKKKKKVKKKFGSGEAISVLVSVSSINGKEVKKKKKKETLDEGTEKANAQNVQEEHVSSEQQLVVVKIEENVQDIGRIPVEVTKAIERQSLNQVNEINSAGYVGEIAAVELKETVDESQPVSHIVPMVMETSRSRAVSDASEQVNQINSVCSESKKLDSNTAETTGSSSTSFVSQTLRSDLNIVQVNANTLEERTEKAAAPTIQEEHVSSKQQLVVVKVEENVQNVSRVPVTKVIERQSLNQVNEINSVSYVGEIATVELKDNVNENQPVSHIVPVVMETTRDRVMSDASEQVNQINSVCSESKKIDSNTAETTGSSSTSFVSQGSDLEIVKINTNTLDVRTEKAAVPDVQEEHVSSKQQLVVKIEENVQNVRVPVTKAIERQSLNQVNEINSVGYVAEIATVELQENVQENSSISHTVPVVRETSRVRTVPDISEQVNQINSVCSESKKLESSAVETTGSNNTSVTSQTLRSDLEVVQINANTHEERSSAPLNCDNTLLTSIANVTRVIGGSVIIPSSSSSSLLDCLVNTSQKLQPTAIIENEAVPSTVGQAVQNTSSTDMVVPKIIHQYLVQPQTCDVNEATNIVPQGEVILHVCDSSIKLEDPMQEGGCITVVNSVIPSEGCGGVDNDYLDRMCPIEYDLDAEILSDLRQHRRIPEDENELVLARNERDFLPRDSDHSNLFATENSNLLIDALENMLPVSSMDLDSRVLYSEDGTIENSLLCAGEEGTQFESPPSDPINENEKRSLECMISNIRNNKDNGMLAQYGTERQDWPHSGSDYKFSYTNCDYMFLANRSQHSLVMPVRENDLATSSFMADDDDDDDDDDYERDDGYEQDDGSERDVSPDEDAESASEYNSCSASSSPRMKMGGGKIGLHNLFMSVNEKDMLNSSSNVSDSPPSLKNAYVSSGIPFKKTNTDNRVILDKPRITEKTPAPLSVTSAPVSPLTTITTSSIISATPISTLKNLNVNLTKCTDINALNDPKKISRTPRFHSVTNSRNCTERRVDVSTKKFADVRGSHSTTEKREKGTSARGQQKKPQCTIPSESGNSVRARGRGRPRTRNPTPPPTRQSKRQGVKRKSTRSRVQDDDQDDAAYTPPKRKKSERTRQAKKAVPITNIPPHTRIKSQQGFVLETIELQNSNTRRRRKR